MKGVIMLSGGKGINREFAVIQVTYPVGSICTATNGQKTLTAPDKSGTVLFTIPEPKTLPETWIVTATDQTDSTKTKSQSVKITTEGQIKSITLSFEFVLLSTTDGLATGYSLSEKGIIPAVQITGFSKVAISAKITYVADSSYYAEFGLSTKAGGSTAVPLDVKSTTTKTIEADISSLGSECYFVSVGSLTQSGNTIVYNEFNAVIAEVYSIIFT